MKKLNFDKTFEDIIENELDFHDYGTVKIEVQQQPHDINPLTCELHQTMFVVLESNPALKVIYMTLAYENDENGIIMCIPTLSAGGKEGG